MIKLIFSTNERRSKGQASRLSGDNSERVTPVPIPNTVVKPLSAENTWWATAREHKSSPEYDITLDEFFVEGFIFTYPCGKGTPVPSSKFAFWLGLQQQTIAFIGDFSSSQKTMDVFWEP